MKPLKKSIPTYVILIALILLSCALTYIIPAGSFDRVKDEALGQTVVVAGSYHSTGNTPVSPLCIVQKLFEAITTPKTAQLIFFILFISGAFEIILKTKCLSLLCENVMYKLRGKELAIIPVFVCLFSVFGFTMGLTTASVVFVPLGIAIAASAGIPKIVGISMIALGTNAGFTAGVFNPFSVGIAQSIAELPMFSGQWLRWVTLVILNTVTSLYLLRYAKKHRVEKSESENVKPQKMTATSILQLIEFVCAFVVLTVRISAFGWSTVEIFTVFLIAAVIMGITAKMSMSEMCVFFTDGCKKVMKGAVIIGLAATIRLILADGNILDSITYGLTTFISDLPETVQLVGMFLFNAVINFLITSGSSKAALVMPILTPMSDLLGISRQSAVYAFQLGDGLTNLASPVSTTLNGVLAVSETDYKEWIRFYIPLVGIYVCTGTLLTVFAQIIGY